MYSRLISPLKNQQGVSLAEGLVSVGAVAGLAALIATLATQTDTKTYTLKRSCESLATSILESVADEGVVADIYGIRQGKDDITQDADIGGTYPTVLSPAQGTFLTTNGPGGEMNIVDPGDMYNGSITLIGAGPKPVINTHMLIKGSMSALNGIYNSGDVCTNWSQYDRLTRFDDPGSGINQMEFTELNSELFQLPTDPEIDMRLQVQLPNGNLGCPRAGGAQPYLIRPGTDSTGANLAFDNLSYVSQSANQGLADAPGDSFVDSGYVLTVRIQFDSDGDGNNEGSCIKSQTFRYPKDNEAPSAPSEFTIIDKYPRAATTEAEAAALLADGLACVERPIAANQAKHFVSIRLRVDNFGPGDVVLCRDTSQTIGQDTAGNESDANNNAVETELDWVYGRPPGGAVAATDLAYHYRDGASRHRMCSGAAGGGQYGVTPDQRLLPNYTAAVAMPGVPSADGNAADGFPGGHEEPRHWATGGNNLDVWVPCQDLRICGVGNAPSHYQFMPGLSNTVQGDYWFFNRRDSLQLNIRWENLPPGCIVGAEARVVDLAGNMSAPVRLDATNVNDRDGQPYRANDEIHIEGSAGQVNDRIFQRPVCATGAQPTKDWGGGPDAFPASIAENGTAQTPHTVGTNTYGEFVPGVGWWCRPPDYVAPGGAGHLESGDYRGAETGVIDPDPLNNIIPEHKVMNWRNTDYNNGGNGAAPTYVYPNITESTDVAGAGGNGNGNWVDDFPNGYYTCRPSGCCVDGDTGATGSCTPFTP